MVEAAGITLPENWSADEYVEVARKLTVPGKTFGSLNAPTLARATLGSNSNYTEAGKSNFADPLFAKELELALSLQKEGTTMPQSQILAEKLKTFPHTPFIAGRVGDGDPGRTPGPLHQRHQGVSRTTSRPSACRLPRRRRASRSGTRARSAT